MDNSIFFSRDRLTKQEKKKKNVQKSPHSTATFIALSPCIPSFAVLHTEKLGLYKRMGTLQSAITLTLRRESNFFLVKSILCASIKIISSSPATPPPSIRLFNHLNIFFYLVCNYCYCTFLISVREIIIEEGGHKAT